MPAFESFSTHVERLVSAALAAADPLPAGSARSLALEGETLMWRNGRTSPGASS